MFQQFADLTLYAQKAANEIISGSWEFQSPQAIDITSSSYALRLDNDGTNSPWIKFDSGGTTYATFRSTLGIPGLFGAPGGSIFFSTSSPTSATAAFTLYNDAGSLSNVANQTVIQGISAPLTWPVLASFQYNATHNFNNHVSTGISWLFNNVTGQSSGSLIEVSNASIPVFDVTWDGNVNIFGSFSGVNRTLSGYADQGQIATPGNPASNYLREYVELVQSIPMQFQRDSGGMVRRRYRDLIQVCHNGHGGTISKGDLVYIKGANSSLPSVGLAKADSASTMPAIGLALESASAGGFFRVLISGLATNLSTTGLTSGGAGYVSEVTAGRITKTMPPFPNLQQRIGTAIDVHATLGIIELDINTQLGDLLGTIQEAFKIGSGAGTPSLDLYKAAGRTHSLRTNATNDRVATLPDATGTLALLSLAQIFSAAQTFSQQIISSLATGTAPLSVTSTTKCTNLNVDQVDGADVGTSGAAIPLLNGSNSWSGTQDFTTTVTGQAATFHTPSNYASICDDFTGNSTTAGDYSWSTQASGTGAAVTNVAGEANHPGIRRSSTGTTTTGYAGLNNRLTFLAPAGGDYFQAIVRNSAATGYVMRIGMQDISTNVDVTDGYYFEIDFAQSANWRICTAKAGTRTKTNTSVAVAGSTWYNLEIKVNSANSSVDYFINGTNVGTITTNIPVAANTTGISWIIGNDGAASANVDSDLDLIYWYNKNLSR